MGAIADQNQTAQFSLRSELFNIYSEMGKNVWQKDITDMYVELIELESITFCGFCRKQCNYEFNTAF